MATPAHELLKIKAAELKMINDAFVQARYEAAKAEINAQIATAEQIATQLKALDKAFEALNTPEKRTNYAAAHPARASAQAVKEHQASKDSIVCVINSKDVLAVKEAYAKFVRENYKDAPDKAKFRPEEYSFKSLEDFQACPFYNKISTNQRDNIIKAGFPCQVLALPFKNKKEANEFHNNMMRKGLIQEEPHRASPRMGC